MSWDNFLKSLETDGGRLLVLIAMLGFIIVVCLITLLSGHPLQEVGKELATGAVSSLLGILYGYLRPSGTKP
jgi:hypothetical protein